VAARDPREPHAAHARRPLLADRQRAPEPSLRPTPAIEQRRTAVPPEVVNVCCSFSWTEPGRGELPSREHAAHHPATNLVSALLLAKRRAQPVQ
jgi:hypothetical protein